MNFKKFTISSMIKDAVDNLPVGLCFFDGRGIPILVNRTMHKLIFALTGHDIQDISDFDNVINAISEITLNDGTIWQFLKRAVDDKNGLIEITASDITELTNQRENLKNGNKEQREVMRHLEEISKDVVEITRNEEILAMKMRIHSELGFALSETRHLITSGCAHTDKELETLYWLVRVGSISIIAEKMGISVDGVNKHIKDLKQKTGINNTNQLAIAARGSRLVLPDY